MSAFRQESYDRYRPIADIRRSHKKIAMTNRASAYLAPAVAIFSILAVSFAGFGGLADTERNRNLFAAGTAFWWLMLLVPGAFLASEDGSHTAHSAASSAYIGLAALCFSLCFASGEGWLTLVTHTAAGAGIGFVSYWLWVIRYGGLWRN